MRPHWALIRKIRRIWTQIWKRKSVHVPQSKAESGAHRAKIQFGLLKPNVEVTKEPNTLPPGELLPTVVIIDAMGVAVF